MRGLFSRVPRIWSLSALTFGIIQLHARSALGSLYPTKPISTTVFLAGQAAQLKWVEDGHAPVISELGHMKIQLFAGNIVSARTPINTGKDHFYILKSDIHCDYRSHCRPTFFINNSLHTYNHSYEFSRLVRTVSSDYFHSLL